MHYIRIEAASNGFVVIYEDPEQVEKNRKGKGEWVSPDRTLVYSSTEEVATAVQELLGKLKPQDSDGEFDAALTEAFTKAGDSNE